MAVKHHQTESNIIYFCTFTCFNWIKLFDITNFYNEIYNWFDILKKKDCKIIGYVIMPNHLHFMIYIPENTNINKIIGNGKRFMAYKIISILEQQQNQKLIDVLKNTVPQREKKKGKLHQVFKPSFDSKPIYTEKFLLQKLDYIHHNPVSGKWELVEDFTDYPHSSAKYYELGIQGVYEVTDYRDGWV